MKTRLLGLFLITVVITLTPGRGLHADSTAMWNTGDIATISHNSFPQTHGNTVAWQARGGLETATSGPGDWEIFLYDLDAQLVIQLTDDDYDDISPQTDGDYVVWQKHDPTRSNRIFLYEIHGNDSPGASIISADDNKDNYSPQIAAGQVVWTSRRVARSFEPGQIMLYDAENPTSPVPISDDTVDCSFPRIDSETVIWVQSGASGSPTLFLYDLSGGGEPYPAPDGYVWEDSPQQDGYLTVMARYDGNDREVFVHNTLLQVMEQITSNSFEDTYPRISGNYIAWVGGEGQASEIFVGLYSVDRDGDGIPDDQDTCPDEDATGFDANGDGCIDTISGLEAMIHSLVEEGVIEEQMQNSLLSKIKNAQGSAEKDNICPAVKELEALKNQVNAQKGKKISDEAADGVITYANSVIAWYLGQLSEGESC